MHQRACDEGIQLIHVDYSIMIRTLFLTFTFKYSNFIVLNCYPVCICSAKSCVWSHHQFVYMYVCTCMHVCTCICILYVYMWPKTGCSWAYRLKVSFCVCILLLSHSSVVCYMSRVYQWRVCNTHMGVNTALAKDD